MARRAIGVACLATLLTACALTAAAQDTDAASTAELAADYDAELVQSIGVAAMLVMRLSEIVSIHEEQNTTSHDVMLHALAEACHGAVSAAAAIDSSLKHAVGVNEDDVAALLSLKAAWGDPEELASWDNRTAASACSWKGIGCELAPKGFDNAQAMMGASGKAMLLSASLQEAAEEGYPDDYPYDEVDAFIENAQAMVNHIHTASELEHRVTSIDLPGLSLSGGTTAVENLGMLRIVNLCCGNALNVSLGDFAGLQSLAVLNLRGCCAAPLSGSLLKTPALVGITLPEGTNFTAVLGATPPRQLSVVL